MPTVITDGELPRLIAGSPATVAAQLRQVSEMTAADEIMMLDAAVDPGARKYAREQFAAILRS